MYRLKKRSFARMNVSRGGKPQAAGQLCAQVTDDIAEKIASDNDVELPGVAHDLHRQGVDIQVAGIDVRVFPADFFEHPLPEVVGKRHGVGFVAHANALQTSLAGALERVTDDALDAFAGIDVLLNGDLVRRALLEEPADAHVEALGVLAENHQANVFFGAVAQRCEPVVKQFHGPGIDVEIELEAKPQQYVGGVLIRRHSGIAKRPEENGVELVAQHLHGARWKGNPLSEILVRAPVKLDKF